MTEAEAKRATVVIAATANALRVRMIQIMLDEEQLVGSLANSVNLSQSATSQHLDVLKKAGLLVQRKHKQYQYCAIEPEWIETLQRLIAIADEQAARLDSRPKRP